MKKTGMRSVLRSVAIVLSAIMLLGALAVASFAEDAVAEVRYKIGENGTWTEGTFADAIANANGDTAIIELQKDVTLTAGVSITAGNITVKSYSGDVSIYSIKRGSTFKPSVFAVSGGTLTLENITLDGQNDTYMPFVNGGMISVTGGILNLSNGATIQNSSVQDINGHLGGAICATAGTINMSAGATIKDCSARKGGAVALSGEVTFNMTGGLITGCEAIGDYSSGSAVYMEKNATFDMSGGVITGNSSYRKGAASSHQVGSFNDGAVAALPGTTSSPNNKVYLSKNAVIWNNKAYKVYKNDAGSKVATDDVVVGGDIVFTLGHHLNTVVNVASDFEGLVGFASNNLISGSGTGVGTAGAGLSEGDVIIGLVETSRTGTNVARVNSSGILEWTAVASEARYQIGSGEWQTGTFAAAIAAAVSAGNDEQTTVLLQKDVTLTAGVSITAGNITVKSYSKDVATYSIKRGGTFKSAIFAVSGGTLTFENITLDGQGDTYEPVVNGGMISMTAGTVNLNDGTTIQNSKIGTSSLGGAIYASTAGTINMSEGVTIKDCKARKGGAIALSGEVTLNMTGGLITGCVAKGSDTDTYASGAAVYMEKNATFDMSGGVITENTSYRTAAAERHADGNFIDGAVAAMPGRSSSSDNKVYLSKNAVIWNNTAYKYDKAAGTYDFAAGGDLVFTIDNHVNEVVNVAADFCGLVGFASNTMGKTETYSGSGITPYVGMVAEDSWNTGDVIVGLVDTTGNRVATVREDGYLEWTDAVVLAYADDGLPRRYASLASAYDAVGSENPIELLVDVIGTDIFTKTGTTAKLILNGNKINITDGIEYETSVATETVGAFTYGSYTYAGKEAEVTTYTVTKVNHICAPGAATADAPSICQECGIIYGFPTDETLTVRYSTDAGNSWIYASFDAAIEAIGTKAAIIELYRDVTLTAGVEVSSNLTVRSLPAAINGVAANAIYSIKRGSTFKPSAFTVSGGTLTFENITLDGQGSKYVPYVNGGMISMTAGAVNLNDGTTIQNSSVQNINGHTGGAIHATGGAITMAKGAKIENCVARKGGAISLSAANFTMNGGLITGCEVIGEYSQGAAIYMTNNSTFNMSGGVIAGNTSDRTYLMPGGSGTVQEIGSFIDGAIGYVGKENTITLSGDATIRNNYGHKYDGTTTTLTLGADVVPCVNNRGPKEIHIVAGFTGSVGIAYPTTGQIGVMDGNFTGILGTVIDANSGKVAKAADGILKWTSAEAEIDVNGKLTRYEKLQDAYAVAGSQIPIKLLANATLTLAEVGDTAKIAENGYALTVVSSMGGFEKSASAQETIVGYTFADCGYTLPDVTVTVVTYKAIEGGSVTSVQLASGTDLTLYFYASLVDKFKESATLVVTRTGDTEADSETQTLTPTYDEASGLYRFVYTGIAPQYAGDPIKIELVCDGKPVFTYNYSVETYCRKALAMDAASLGLTEEKCGELHTNLRDLLAYCASAQTYLGYNTDGLVNKGIEGSEFVLPASTPKEVIVNNNTVNDATFTEAGVRFDNANNIFFEFTTTDPTSTKVVIGNKTYTEFTAVAGKTNTYRVYTDDLSATQFDVIYTAKLYFGDTLLQTCKYSVGAYAYSLATSDGYTEAEKNLAMATYNYGVAARIWMDSYSKTTVASSVAGANMLGGASLDGSALAMNNDASGIEFAYRGKGDIVLNLTATKASRIEITVDGATVNHFLVAEGTADYTVFKGLDDGKHTVRIVKENGADLALNSVFVKGYFTKVDAQDSMYIEFIGSDTLLGKNLFLNYESYEDDATGAYAVLAARELGAKYLISDTFAGSATAPDLVVIEYKNGESYTELLASIREAYGDVNILFVGDAETSEALGEEIYCQLTADTTGIDGYPSAGGAAIQGAELAKYIRENFFTEMVESASDDIIVAVDAAANGYNTFHVYVKTSDPSGKYYIRYNFVHEYDTNYEEFGTTSAPTGISNFRIKAAECVEVTNVGATSVTSKNLYNVLHGGEISAALKTMSKNGGTSASTDFTGGFHGDEWILGVNGKEGNIGDVGWTPAVKLLADGVEIDVVNGEAKVITCHTLTFDQTSMMYEWGTGSDEAENEVAKRGTPLLVHTQHFTITREGGIHNRQGFEWQKDIKIVTKSNYLLMFTMFRYANQKDVCTDVELFNVDGASFGKASVSGPVSEEYSVLEDEANRYVLYSGKTSGVSAYAGYDLCHVGKFANNSATLSDMKVNIRASQGDNKLYARFVSTNEDPSQIYENDFWTVDVAYGIDYVNPNN